MANSSTSWLQKQCFTVVLDRLLLINAAIPLPLPMLSGRDVQVGDVISQPCFIHTLYCIAETPNLSSSALKVRSSY